MRALKIVAKELIFLLKFHLMLLMIFYCLLRVILTFNLEYLGMEIPHKDY